MGNVITTIVEYSTIIYNKVDETLDFISFHLCPNKPSYKLATDNLHIPEEDLSMLMALFNLACEAFGLLIVPFKMINDKKFTVHIYETATVFMTQGAQQSQNIVSACDKMLMYIAQNRSKIDEPVNKQILKTVDIHSDDYDIPVNFWYTFEIDTGRKIYFFVHISVISNYKGVVIAVDKNNERNLTLMKEEALDYYDQTCGAVDADYCEDKKMDFI